MISAAFVAIIAAMPTAEAAEPRRTADARALLTEHKCYICHADRETKTGPAYVDVSAYFRGRRDAVSTIGRNIRNGFRGGGPWHMPPHPEVSPAEARAMARYILSLER